MVQEKNSIVLITATILIVLVVAALIILFTIFQKRKNKLLLAQEEAKKQFEREIAESQIEIREETLRNISWELHDNIGQLLTLAKIQLQTDTNNLDEVKNTLSKSLTELRSLSKLINPDVIKNIKLKEAIQLEIDRFNRLNFIKSKLSVSGVERKIDEKNGIIIFRILQEFFSNTIKHSKATELTVEMIFKPNSLTVIASDNGIGFTDTNVKGKGIGLQNIENRAKLIGATAKFNSEKNKGTELEIIYPK